MLFAENAVAGEILLDQRTDRRFRRLVGFRHRVETTLELVDDARADAKARQGFRLGGIGETIEKGAVGQHVTLFRERSRKVQSA
ncbi:hypothetical protein D3C86_1987160 [compost metagenome]